MIKLYHFYRTNKKKINKEHPNLKKIIIKQGTLHGIVVIIVLSIILHQNFSIFAAKANTNNLHNTVMSNLVIADFANLPSDEELIKETRSTDFTDTTISKINQQSGVINPSIQINTKQNKGETNNIQLDISPELAMKLQIEAEKFGNNENINYINEETNNTVIQTERNKTITYKVQPGDTISSIANKFNITVKTILWENNLSSSSLIHPGDTLSILPLSGIRHTVKSGESISYIANYYDVETSKILSTNNISDVNTLKIGQKLIIPGASKINSTTNIASKSESSAVSGSSSGIDVIKKLIKPEPVTANTGAMKWPTVGHRITQYYSWRHTGLDIANKTGTPLYASEGGTIDYSGWSNGYGYNVLINHGGGKKTRYAHASKLYVKKGDVVSKGEAVAAMGSTGWSTGPHIHFEVIINGVKKNPLNYIK